VQTSNGGMSCTSGTFSVQISQMAHLPAGRQGFITDFLPWVSVKSVRAKQPAGKDEPSFGKTM